jgi:ADP-heptose:LPS heptosyltransferase
MITSILFYNSGGGIGDALQIMPLINSLKTNLKNTKFYYLSAHENLFNTKLKDFNCEIETLDLSIKYFGFRWWHFFVVKNRMKKNKIKSFDLIVDLQSKIRNSIILKKIPHKYFLSPCLNFKLSKPKLNIQKNKKNYETALNSINFLLNKNYEINKFNLNSINKTFFEESKRLLPSNNYVGLSITQGNIYRKKEWPMKNVIKLSNILIQNKKKVVFFIEKKNTQLKNDIQKIIPEALFPEHETNISSPALVSSLGKRLDFAVTIDNGIMHMLAISEVPLISLFGPTDSEKFAPPYKDSIILDSKKIYNSNDISRISVEDVLNAAKQFLNFSN